MQEKPIDKQRAAKHYKEMAEQARKEREVKSLDDAYAERMGQAEYDKYSEESKLRYCGECGQCEGYGHLNRCSKYKPEVARAVASILAITHAPLTVRPSAGGFVVEAHFSKYEEAQEYMKRHFEGVK